MEETFIYSPFSQHTQWDQNTRSLLLQFILKELIAGQTQETIYVTPTPFFPYDWSHAAGALNKIEEHLMLFPYAFPKMAKDQKIVAKALKEKSLSQLYRTLKPFISACEGAKSLQDFMEKNRAKLNIFEVATV